MSTYFHGSVTDKISQFRPFSHFGTMDQAISAIAKKAMDWKNDQRKLTGTSEPVPTMYEVAVDQAALANPLRVADWGTPRAIGIAKAMRDAFDESNEFCIARYRRFDEIRAHLTAVKNDSFRELPNDEEVRRQAAYKLDQQGWPLLKAEMDQQGWTCLLYQNNVEGPSPAPSVCVPDPRHISIVRRWLLTDEQLRGAMRQVKHF